MREDDIIRQRISGRSVMRAIAQARRTSVAEVNEAIDRRSDRRSPTKPEHGLALELARLDELQEVFYQRAIEGRYRGRCFV